MRRHANENSIQPKHKIHYPFSVTRAAQHTAERLCDRNSSMTTPVKVRLTVSFQVDQGEHNGQSAAMCCLIILEEIMS